MTCVPADAIYLFHGWLEERREARAQEITSTAAEALRSIVATARAAEAFFDAAAKRAHAERGAQSELYPAAAPASASSDAPWPLWSWLQSTIGIAPLPTAIVASDSLVAIGLGDGGPSTPCDRRWESNATSPGATFQVTQALPSLPREEPGRAPCCTSTPSIGGMLPATPPAGGTAARTSLSALPSAASRAACSATTTHFSPSPVSPAFSPDRDSSGHPIEELDLCPGLGVLIERCRALLRLRTVLGPDSYAVRKDGLLWELVVAVPHLPSLEHGAQALEALHTLGFVDSQVELAEWTDRLLGSEQAAGVVAARLDAAQGRGAASPVPLTPHAMMMHAAEGSHAGGDHGNEESGGAAGGLEGSSARRLLLVSVLGSMDDVAVFISILLGETFTWPQLLLGVLIGSTLVVSFCLFVTLFAPVTRLIQLVPLYVVVASFAVYTLVDVAVATNDVNNTTASD